jgi:signal transduction histidine kinase
MPAKVRVLVAGSVTLGLLTLGALVTSAAAHGDAAVWAAKAGWTLGSVAALSGTLAAALSGTRFSASWRFHAAAAGCWLAGAILLDIQAGGQHSGVTDVFWLGFPLLEVASMLRRLPRPAVYGIFLLDAIPVILLIIASQRSGFFIRAPGGQASALLTELYPVLYLLLAANTIQLAGLYESLRDIRPWVRLFTVAFCLMALAALIGGHPSAASASGAAHWAAPLWTIGLLGLGVSGVLRATHPDAPTSLPLTDKQGGPHALPPAAAVLGLIVLLTVVPGRQRALVQAFLIASAILLFIRVYLVHRQDVRLYAESLVQQAQLTTHNERLRELDHMKDEFIALVSHELRTPLTSIIGYLEMLDDPDLSEEQRAFTVIIHRNAKRLLRLVGDLLFLAGLQAGKLKIEPGEADLAELAGHALEAARPAAERKQITLAFSAGPVPAIPGDGGRIAQLLDNLLSNAVKFTPERGHITVSLGTEGHSALLSVADDGTGISTDDQERVFERFFRTDLATSRAVQGTGLGLAICQAIVDSHDGTISVESQPSRGTTFRVRLPLRSARHLCAVHQEPPESVMALNDRSMAACTSVGDLRRGKGPVLRARQTGSHPSAAEGLELPVTCRAHFGLPQPPAASRSRGKGGAHARSRSRGVARRTLGFAASTAAMMVPFVLLSILMLAPPDPALAPPDLVLVQPKTAGMGVCIPGPVTPGQRCAGAGGKACLTGLSPREPGFAGRPPAPAALCAVRHAPHRGICRGDRQPRPCPGPR